MSTYDVAASRGAKLAHANGIEIAYSETGDGPPLVLLHGAFVSTGPAWAGSPVAHVDHLATLAKHFRVIAPDTRSSGATVHPGGPATFDVLANDVASLIETLGLARPAVVGFSEGGTTATVLALRHPDSVSTLVNHAGFDYFDPYAPAHQMLRPVFGGRPDATTADPDATERAFAGVPEMADTLARMKADYDGAQGEGHWRDYLGQFFDRCVEPVEYGVEDVGRLSMPTLILTGDRDHFCPPSAAAAAYETLEHGELAVLPATGHEITPAVIDTIVAFLIRYPRADVGPRDRGVA